MTAGLAHYKKQRAREVLYGSYQRECGTGGKIVSARQQYQAGFIAKLAYKRKVN